MPGEFPGIFFSPTLYVCIETAQVPQWCLFQPGSGGLLRHEAFCPHSSLAGFANCR
jgi:hypothetical protein